MSRNWHQGGGQPPGDTQNNVNQDHSGPPPICFKCSGPHFVVNCPGTSQPASKERAKLKMLSGVNGFTPNQFAGNNNGSVQNQNTQWPHAQTGHGRQHYPRAPPVVTKFAAPSAQPGYESSAMNSSYQGPQSFNQGPHQYSAPPVPAPYSYNQQFAQPYSAPPTQQYANQVPPYNQYPQAYSQPGPPQQFNPAYQPFQQAAPPVPTPYQTPASPYPQSPYSGTPNLQHAPQWGHSPQGPPYSAPAYEQPNKHFNAGYRRDQSTPRNQPRRASQSGPQNHTRQQTPNTPATSTHGAFVAGNLKRAYSVASSNAPDVPKSASPSVSGTLSRSKSMSGSVDVPTTDFATLGKIVNEVNAQAVDAGIEAAIGKEEGELGDEELAELDFQWEHEMIFKEPPSTEAVALAQPLSTSIESTPVPLLNPNTTNSVSRYARKENKKDFARPIRSQPQWSYLQEDPAFAPLKLDSPLIPLNGLRAWMCKRQGLEVIETAQRSVSARKRARSLDRSIDAQNQVLLEPGSVAPEGNKRQKQEDKDADQDGMALDTNEVIAAPSTPPFNGSDAPDNGDGDDAWIPDPGETAEPPLDPTEALLMSLGVEGSPKPVTQQDPGPQAARGQEFGDQPYGNGYDSVAGQFDNSQTNFQTAQHNGAANGYNHGPPAHHPYPNHPPPPPPYPPHHNQNHGGHGPGPYNMPPQGQYNSTMQAANSNQGYGQPGNNSYGNGQHSQGKPAYNQQYNQTYNPPNNAGRHNSYGNNMPQQAHPPPNQYAAQRNQNYPPHNLYGDGDGFVGPQSSAGGNSADFGNGLHQNGFQNNTARGGPPQGLNGHGNGNPHQFDGQYRQSHGSQHATQQQPAQPDQGNQRNSQKYQDPNAQAASTAAQNQAGPPNDSNQAPRHDSGYASAGGAQSNAEESGDFFASLPSQFPKKKPISGGTDGGTDTPSPSKPKKLQTKVEAVDSEDDPDESPLSPTSAEILGKLTTKPKRVISGKKRPQPVVEAAYSRRW